MMPPLAGCGLDPLCALGESAAGLGNSAAQSAIESLKQAILDALAKAMASLGTIWVRFDSPNLTGSNPGPDGAVTPSETVAFIQGSLLWYTVAFAVLATMVGGLRMAWERRAEPGRDVVKGLLTMIVVSAAGLTFIWHAMKAADGFSQWIIDRSVTGTDFATNVIGLVKLSSATSLGPMLVILVALVTVFVAIVQIMLMVARTAMLVVLAGVLPCISSFTSTEMGRETFKKACAWTIALILYKPAAAVIYATDFKLLGAKAFDADGTGLQSVLVGLMLMVMALLALPALMKLVTPAVGAVSGGGGGGAGGALASALPSGAMALGGGRGRGSAGSGAPPPGDGPPGSRNATPPARPPGQVGSDSGSGVATANGGGAGTAAGGTAAAGGGAGVASTTPHGAAVAAGAGLAQKGQQAVVSNTEKAASDPSEQSEEGPRGSA